jgi:integrase/recombinase XerC
MNAAQRLCRTLIDELRESLLAEHVADLERYFSERCYAPRTIEKYLSCFAHFARWMSEQRLRLEEPDEDTTARFLDGHLPHCCCPGPVSRTDGDRRAALGHLQTLNPYDHAAV